MCHPKVEVWKITTWLHEILFSISLHAVEQQQCFLSSAVWIVHFVLQKFRMSHADCFSHNSSAIEHIGLTLFQMSSSNTDFSSEVDNMKSKCEPSKAVDNSQPGNTVCPNQTKIKSSEAGYMDAGQKGTLAYVLHTSGTTGIPKIVRVPHKCIVPNIQHLK